MTVPVENMGFYALSSVAFDVVRGISWALTCQPLRIPTALAELFHSIIPLFTRRNGFSN